MKAYVLFVSLFMTVATFASKPVTKDGYCDGKKLCGRVLVVDNVKPDFYVFVDSSFENLSVKSVSYSSSRPGEWQFVSKNQYHDFTVKFVDDRSRADFTIKMVKSGAGVHNATAK